MTRGALLVLLIDVLLYLVVNPIITSQFYGRQSTLLMFERNYFTLYTGWNGIE